MNADFSSSTLEASTPAASDISHRPDLPPTDELEVACYERSAEGEQAVESLVAAGLNRDQIIILKDRDAKTALLTKYAHVDADRHTQASAGAVAFASFVAVVLGLLSLAVANSLDLNGIAVWAAAIMGGIIGAAIGGVLGATAFRQADDKSIELIEKLCRGEVLIGVRRSMSEATISLDDISKVLTRHGGHPMRLHYRPDQADLHPGDTRQDF